MPWMSMIAPVAGALLGGSSSGSSSGGSQTVSKDPWAPAQPWLTSLLGQGQNLQAQYSAQPFNAIQKASYGNLLAGNDYINQMAPGLLAQFSQSQGFDRNNPRAKPAAIQFPAMAQNFQPTAGLLGQSMQQATATPAPAPAANPGYVTGLFGTVPAPAPVPGLTSPAPLPTTWQDWVNQGLGANGGY